MIELRRYRRFNGPVVLAIFVFAAAATGRVSLDNRDFTRWFGAKRLHGLKATFLGR